MLDQALVALASGDIFGRQKEGNVRLSYPTKIPVIQKAIYRMNHALNNRKID